MLNKSKHRSKYGHKKGATFTNLPSKLTNNSFLDQSQKQPIDIIDAESKKSIFKSRRKSTIMNKQSFNHKVSQLKNVSQVNYDTEPNKTDVMGRFRHKFTRTTTNFKDMDLSFNNEDQDNQESPEDAIIIQDLQELLEIINGISFF
jgi:hypothetical protein